MSDPYLYRIRDLVFRASGIFHTDNKFYFLEDRCGKRMTALGMPSLREYFELLSTPVRASDQPQRELRSLLNEITVGETSFFRNQPQIEALRRSVLPGIMAAKDKLGFRHIRIWSAGCSTGEEPYTLAMVLNEEAQGPMKGWSFEVLAMDINDLRLAKAKEAVYSDYYLRNVPPYYKHKYFRKVGDQFQVTDDIRAKVSFERMNMLDDSRMVFMKGMDVIFCCNVLIYFGGEPKRRVIQHFHNNLFLNGVLFLGHSESLFGISSDFRMTHLPGCVAYYKATRKLAPAGYPSCPPVDLSATLSQTLQ